MFISPSKDDTVNTFFTAINLAGWLLGSFGGLSCTPLKEGDDAAAATKQLLSLLQQAGFLVPSHLTPTKLQAGSTLEILGILSALTDWRLEQSTFQFGLPQHSNQTADGCAACSF
jgi:Intra-flagellar transport protein 57